MKAMSGVALATLLLAASTAGAQQPPAGGPSTGLGAGGQRAGGPPPLSNLQIIPKDTGFFRNVVPQLAEDMVKTVQRDTWTNKIDLPAVEMKRD